MKNFLALFLSAILILAGAFPPLPVSAAPSNPSDPWWDGGWPYRLRVDVSGSGVAQVAVDFTAVFQVLGLNQALLDLRSLRVVPYDGGEKPLSPIAYAESYSTPLPDAETLARWRINTSGSAALDSTRFTNGSVSVRTEVINIAGGYDYPGVEYLPAALTNWSAYETFLYDVWPEVNASALDQAPDLYWFKLYNACADSAITQGGPPLALNRWNYASVSLNPLDTCRSPQLNLANITRMEFHTRDNASVNGRSGLWDDGDILRLWFDNLRLVDQNAGALRWQTRTGISVYYIYFDTLTHAGHPQSELTAGLGPATLTGVLGAPEAGGYYHQVEATSGAGSLQIWAAPSVEKILRTMAAPVDSFPLWVSAARGEFEPFQIVVRSPAAQNLAVSASSFTQGGRSIPAPTLHRVDYVNITTAGDAYDRLGWWPDPLWPLDNPSTVAFPAGENQPLWFTVHIPWDAAPGQYTGSITIGGAVVPVNLLVWDFSLPRTIHLDSEWGFSWSSIVEDIYQGSTDLGGCYWDVVEAFKQDFIDHRLVPKGVAWPAGLNAPGGIDFNCTTGVLDPDSWGDWGFAAIGGRYIHGVGGFNAGYGFPVFLGFGPRDNYPPDSLPYSFCGIERSGVLGSPEFQAKWKQYLSALDAYLVSDNYTSAYYHIVNEPQTFADYTVVGQISALTEAAAPHLRQMVSEQVETEIYSYPGAKIDIWMPTITNYEPIRSQDRQLNHGEQVWWYFLYGDDPPLPNPILMSHPGLEARLLPWLAWNERVDGLLHYSATDWNPNPWTTPNVTGRDNGDAFFFYPPNKDGSYLSACGANGNRLVPSIRWENLRDGMEDYEYLWLLAGNPQIGQANAADAYVAHLVASRTLFSLVPTDLVDTRASLAQALSVPWAPHFLYLPFLKK